MQRERKVSFTALAFLLPFIISIGICIFDDVYPFGTNCILHVDMYHQYCPFFTEFWRKLHDGESLMYSWKVGLGSDFFSVFVYYLASPLNWLLILCPQKLIIEFMTLLILVKMGLSGLFFYLYLAYHFRSRNLKKDDRWAALVFSTAYALCGFVTAYNWDIMWMDCVALAPLVMMGLEKLVREGKSGLYYGSLALAILANYYLAIMICIFAVFDFVLLFFTQEKTAFSNRAKTVFRFGWYSLLAGGTGLVMILPELQILSDSGSSGITLPKKFEMYFNLLAEAARMCTTAAVYTGNNHWPNLYAGAFTILLVFCYAFHRGISWKEKLPRLFMILFMYVSFACNWLDWFWHGLHFPDSLPGRESYLFALLLLIVAYDVYLRRTGLGLLQIVPALACSEILIGVGTWLTDKDVTDISSGIMTCLLLLLYAAALIWEKLDNEENGEMVRQAAMTFALVELVVNIYSAGFYTTSRTTYTNKQSDYSALLEAAEQDALKQAETDDLSKVFYRVENTERKTKNDDCLYGYASSTQFSSLMNINVSHFFQAYYMEGGKNYYCYNGATPITSAFLSVKYVISDSPYEESELRTLVAKSGNQYLYRNNYTAPLGVVLSENAAAQLESSDLKKIDRINELGNVLGAHEDTLESLPAETEVSENSTVITIPCDGYFYASDSNCTADTLTFSYENGKEISYSKTTHTYLFDLGYCSEGEKITVRNSAGASVDFQLYALNMNAVKTSWKTLTQQTMDLTEYTTTSIKGSISMEEAGRLVISVPAEKGWSLYVDGEQREIQKFEETFISVSLESGEHEICLKYETPGLKTGGTAAAVCLLLAAGTLLIAGRTRQKAAVKD